MSNVVLIGTRGRIAAAAGTLLASRGHHVLGLARRPHGAPLPFPVRQLTLTDPVRLAADLAGADVVVYGAGAHHGAVETIPELAVFGVNTLGALVATLAADHQGARRFVYLSSTAAMAAEDGPPPGAYVRSKRLAERLLLAAGTPGLTILRLGWVIDPTDQVAYQHLWPPSGNQVIVGSLPVPMLALADVAEAIALLAGDDSFDNPGLTGLVDLVAGCPTQAQLYGLVSELAPRPLRITDARTVDRVARVASARRSQREAPTWLTQSVPAMQTDWRALGVPLTPWQDCVRALWHAHQPNPNAVPLS